MGNHFLFRTSNVFSSPLGKLSLSWKSRVYFHATPLLAIGSKWPTLVDLQGLSRDVKIRIRVASFRSIRQMEKCLRIFFFYVLRSWNLFNLYSKKNVLETIEYIDDTTLIELRTVYDTVAFCEKAAMRILHRCAPSRLNYYRRSSRLSAISGWPRWLNADRRGIIGGLNGKEARNEADR